MNYIMQPEEKQVPSIPGQFCQQKQQTMLQATKMAKIYIHRKGGPDQNLISQKKVFLGQLGQHIATLDTFLTPGYSTYYNII